MQKLVRAFEELGKKSDAAKVNRLLADAERGRVRLHEARLRLAQMAADYTLARRAGIPRASRD